MNYYPDEVELWLVDFKKTEFRRYAESCPPHLKYLLLEESEDLIFDLIDELTKTLNERMRVFSDNGWSKLSEVPSQIYMPAIFIIIDEFAQVSQKLRDSQFSGETNYVRKLENILAKGAAFGVKFIFASQSYNTGIEGLSQTARKQIQMRFALKNTADEVKDTLNLNSYQIDERLMQLISSLRVYETLFKRIDDNTGLAVVDRYFNLKVEMSELKSAIEFLNSKLHSTDSSLKICKQYAIRYDFVKIYSQSNKGQGAARNYGLSIATGKYIFFIDSDDYVPKENFLSNILNIACTKNVDILEFEMLVYSSDGTSFVTQKKLLENKLYLLQRYTVSSNLELSNISSIDSRQPPKIFPLNIGFPPNNSNPLFAYFSISVPMEFSLKSSLSRYQISLGRTSLI